MFALYGVLVRDLRGEAVARGCQTLDCRRSLAFVRPRHQETAGDLGRSRNQQRFLPALAGRVTEPGNALNPSRLYPALGAGLENLVVDRNLNLQKLAGMFRSVRGAGGREPRHLTTPVDVVGLATPKGNVVRWDAERAARLFRELREDRPVTVAGGG
ncbi:LCP family protein [Streptomyces baarnensis]|uniref:LCP family protein n=1 Tax=Streptomyces TaxID=1883 RepID=UPI0029B238E7|nr:LCP family protein [Streptomyces sp. ME02-6979.5a]MDX3342692.1 LCP family protein [Streptomyces sp. ME02-6979.5a]